MTRPPREVGRMVRDAGTEFALFQPFRDFECMPEPRRTRAKFDLVGELGAGLMLVCPNVSSISLGGIDRAAADLPDLETVSAWVTRRSHGGDKSMTIATPGKSSATPTIPTSA